MCSSDLASELTDSVAEFRRFGNLFEIVSAEYWRENHGYRQPAQIVQWAEEYLSDPVGRVHMEKLAEIRARAAGTETSLEEAALDLLGQPQRGGVGVQCPFAQEGVLVRAHPGGAVVSRTEGEGSVRVTDDGDLTGPGSGAQSGRLVEDQAVGGIHRTESLALDVGRASKQLERHAHEPSA